MRCDGALRAPLSAGGLVVRRMRPGDAAALHAVLSDPGVMRWLEPPFTPDQTAAFIDAHGLCDPPRVYAVARTDGEVVGHVVFHPWDGAAWEIGWALRRDLWGVGYATAITRALVGHARRVGIPALVIEFMPENRASRRVAEKCGFTHWRDDGGLAVWRLTFDRQALPPRDCADAAKRAASDATDDGCV